MIKWDPEDAQGCIKKAETAATIIYGDHNNGFAYRFKDQRVGEHDGYTSRLEVYLDAWPVLKFTPAGYTIPAKNSRGFKFIGKDAHRKFAYQDIEQAIESFLIRKRRQAAIYHHRFEDAELAAEMIRRNKLDLGIFE